MFAELVVVDVSMPIFGALGLAVFLGTILQRLAGQGFGMIAAPIAALVAPQHLPATILLLGIVVGASALSMDLKAVSWKEAAPGFFGRALGAFAGAGIAAAISAQSGFGVLVGALILFAVGLSASGLHLPITNRNLFLAGTTAGVMGTVVAVGAPPMAILYANEDPVRSRAMQNLFYAWGMVWSVSALLIAGLIDVSDVLLTLALVPIAVSALFLSRPMAHWAAAWPMKPIALSIAGLAAIMLIGRSI